jgi:hypothetical protein
MQMRQTAAAGTVTGPLGDLGDRKEKHLLPLRPAARARRPAVNASGADRVNELSVNAGVPLQDGAPLGFFDQAVGVDLLF